MNNAVRENGRKGGQTSPNQCLYNIYSTAGYTILFKASFYITLLKVSSQKKGIFENFPTAATPQPKTTFYVDPG